MTTMYWESQQEMKSGKRREVSYPPITVCNYQRMSLQSLHTAGNHLYLKKIFQQPGLLTNPNLTSLFYLALHLPGPLMFDSSVISDTKLEAAAAYKAWYNNENNVYKGWPLVSAQLTHKHTTLD